MTAPLSDTRLAQYRNLLAAAHLTPGPWKVEYESCCCSDYPCGHGSYVSAISAPVPTESSKERLERTGERPEYYDFYQSEVGDFSAADWELMVAARNGLPELLAEVDRLKAEFREAMDNYHGAAAEAKKLRAELADASCPAECPCRSTPLPARWDKTVVHPTPGDTECPDTLVCCVAATGQPVALWLDDEHREALGLALLLPDSDGDIDPQHLELQRDNERLAAEVSTLRAQVTAVEEHARRKSHRGVVVDPNILLMIIADPAAPTS